MNKPIKKITFVDHLDQCSITEDKVAKILSKKYTLVLDDENPDIAICNMWGTDHLDVSVFKIYLTGETYVEPKGLYDLYVSFEEAENENEFQFCLAAHNYSFPELKENTFNPETLKKRNALKMNFCAFMYANKYSRARVWFCRKLHKYKWVDCLGLVLNNTKINANTGRYASDWAMQLENIYKNYKFVISFENTNKHAVVCEKIAVPLYVGAVPIYWGTRDIGQFYNPDCFINAYDFDSFDDCVEYVKKVDNDPVLYQKYRNAIPVLPDSRLHDMTEDKMAEWMLGRLDDMEKSNYIPIGKIFGIARIKCKFNNWWWRKKQRVVYKWQILLEFLGLK